MKKAKYTVTATHKLLNNFVRVNHECDSLKDAIRTRNMIRDLIHNGICDDIVAIEIKENTWFGHYKTIEA